MFWLSRAGAPSRFSAGRGLGRQLQPSTLIRIRPVQRGRMPHGAIRVVVRIRKLGVIDGFPPLVVLALDTFATSASDPAPHLCRAWRRRFGNFRCGPPGASHTGQQGINDIWIGQFHNSYSLLATVCQYRRRLTSWHPAWLGGDTHGYFFMAGWDVHGP